MVWDEVSELVKRRNTAAALAKLDALAKERDLRDHARQIEADRKAMTGLQALQRIVSEQAAKLEPGKRDRNLWRRIHRRAVRGRAARGDVLVLKTKSLRRRRRSPFSISLRGRGSSWPRRISRRWSIRNSPWASFWRSIGFQIGRGLAKLLNEAAAKGDEMTVWLERLEESDKNPSVAKKSKKDGQGGGTRSKDEPVVVSTWAHQVHERRKGQYQTADLHSSIRTGRSITPRALATWQIKAQPAPLTWPDRHESREDVERCPDLVGQSEGICRQATRTGSHWRESCWAKADIND